MPSCLSAASRHKRTHIKYNQRFLYHQLSKMSSNDVSVSQLISMLSRLTLGTLLASQIAVAAMIPRQVPVVTVTVTDVATNSVYASVATSIDTVFYTSTSFLYSPADPSSTSHSPAASASLNPINGLPVPVVSNTTRTSQSPTITSASIIVITPLTSTTIDGTPTLVPFAHHSTSRSGSITSKTNPSVSSSSSSIETPAPTSSSKSSAAPTSTTSKHHRLTVTINLFPTTSHSLSSTERVSSTTSIYRPSSTGDRQGEIGE